MIRSAHDAMRIALTQRARAISGRFASAPPEQPPDGEPESSDSEACRSCCGAGPYLLALAAQSVLLLQFGVHPSVGGPSGALSSAIQAVPSPVWQTAHIALAALGDRAHRARIRVNNTWGVPAYSVSLHFSQFRNGHYPPGVAAGTIMAVRPDYLTVCLTGGPKRRDVEVGDNGLSRLAPWRWRRSADGGASWADVPHSPHRESNKTEVYTFRYVPTPADLADENVRLRACVNVRAGGEVCSAGASPRP